MKMLKEKGEMTDRTVQEGYIREDASRLFNANTTTQYSKPNHILKYLQTDKLGGKMQGCIQI